MRTSRFQGSRRPLRLVSNLPAPIVIPPEIAAKNEAFADRARDRFKYIDAWPPRLRRLINIVPRAIYPVATIEDLFQRMLAEHEGDRNAAADATVTQLKRSMMSRRVRDAQPEKRTSF